MSVASAFDTWCSLCLFRKHKEQPCAEEAADEDIGNGPAHHVQPDQFKGFEAKGGKGAQTTADTDQDKASVVIGDVLLRFVAGEQEGKQQAADEVRRECGKGEGKGCF